MIYLKVWSLFGHTLAAIMLDFLIILKNRQILWIMFKRSRIGWKPTQSGKTHLNSSFRVMICFWATSLKSLVIVDTSYASSSFCLMQYFSKSLSCSAGVLFVIFCHFICNLFISVAISLSGSYAELPADGATSTQCWNSLKAQKESKHYQEVFINLFYHDGLTGWLNGFCFYTFCTGIEVIMNL